MKIVKWFTACAALSLCLSSLGCDPGGSEPETMTNQSELEAFLAENPDVDAEADTGEEDVSDE
tara:strand:- start:128382 stop:128570 length:189 start_codon:yes stop_codon:yes gene_type:complete